MITTFAGALEFGPLVRVNDAWCPNCGRARPEALAFPFTADPDVFRAFQPNCPICGAGLKVDVEPADDPLGQHMVIHTDDQGTRVAVDVKPDAAGTYQLGVTPGQPDRPSGAAPAVPGESFDRFVERIRAAGF